MLSPANVGGFGTPGLTMLIGVFVPFFRLRVGLDVAVVKLTGAEPDTYIGTW